MVTGIYLIESGVLP